MGSASRPGNVSATSSCEQMFPTAVTGVSSGSSGRSSWTPPPKANCGLLGVARVNNLPVAVTDFRTLARIFCRLTEARLAARAFGR